MAAQGVLTFLTVVTDADDNDDDDGDQAWEIPVLLVVGMGAEKCTFIFILYHDMPRNITQQLMKTLSVVGVEEGSADSCKFVCVGVVYGARLTSCR